MASIMRRASGKSSSRGGRGAQEPQVPSVDMVAVDAIFDQFADPEDTETMNMEGIANLATELGLDPETDVTVLVLCWKLKSAKKPGEIQRDEFQKGMEAVGCSSTKELQAALPSFDPGFMEHKDFRDFYRFCFQFNREGTQRTIEKEAIMELLPLCMMNRSIFLEEFLEFLPTCGTTRITADQWNSFLEFSHAVSADLSGYEEDSAWPLLLDEFVEWKQAKK